MKEKFKVLKLFGENLKNTKNEKDSLFKDTFLTLAA